MTRRTAASLLREALENLGVRHTFGIPGVHNTEIYDELNASDTLRPVLVTHEGGGAFMADAVSRCGGELGVLVIVPGAGVTHALSGITEAFLDGIPMLVISGGIRRDTGYRYQLHDIDQLALLAPVTKAAWRVERHDQLLGMVYDAARLANSGEPGPVFLEIPVELQLIAGEAGPTVPLPPPARPPCKASGTELARAARLLQNARKPAIFVGWGAVDASAHVRELAERLGAPVATTLQGLSSFPADHPLHAGFCLGPAAVPAVQDAFADCDVVLAVGTRFAEIATGSYGWKAPEQLIHVDINPEVFNANYPASVCLEGDAQAVLGRLVGELGTTPPAAERRASMEALLAARKASYRKEWLDHNSGERVNPLRFFEALDAALSPEATVVLDDGNHTFLAAELLPVHRPRGLISPTDFNCMGYCVPATIGAKLTRPQAPAVGIVGDGALRMTGLELATASALELGVVLFVFNDGELAQIAQAQAIPYNRKTCTVLGMLDIEGLAQATGAQYLHVDGCGDLNAVMRQALAWADQGKPVLVDVTIDYTKRTSFTQGIVRNNLRRFDLRTQARFVGRALWRRVTDRSPSDAAA